MPLVGLLKFVSFTRSLVIKFWATAPAASALACRLETEKCYEVCNYGFSLGWAYWRHHGLPPLRMTMICWTRANLAWLALPI